MEHLQKISEQLNPFPAANDIFHFGEEKWTHHPKLLLGFRKNGTVDGLFVPKERSVNFNHEENVRARNAYFAVGILSGRDNLIITSEVDCLFSDDISYSLAIYSSIFAIRDESRKRIPYDLRNHTLWATVKFERFEHIDDVYKYLKLKKGAD